MDWKEALGFSRKQQKGTLVLLAIAILLGLGRHFWPYLQQPDLSRLAPPPVELEAETTKQPVQQSIEINRADSLDWVSLPGIGPVLSGRIIRYRRSLGGFRSISQLEQVYGLRPEVLKQITPFLRLDSSRLAAVQEPSGWPAPVNRSSPERVEINTADAAKFERLPVLGKVLSRRLVRFRESRGGFRSVEEVGDLYGLSAEDFARLRPYLYLDSSRLVETARKDIIDTEAESPALSIPASDAPAEEIQLVDINRADSASLVAVPGIGPKTAPRIIKYRRLIGFYHSVDQLRKVYGVSERNFQRMKSHLTAKPLPEAPKPNLNRLSARSLGYYPFLDSARAAAIVARRKQLGRYSHWQEVAEALDSGTIAIMQAYFRIDP